MKCPAARPTKHRIIKTRSWKESSIKDFLSELEKTPWSFLDWFDDIDDTYSAWESLFKSLIDIHFPTKLKRVRKQTHPWLDRSVLRLMRERDHQHKKAIKHGLSTDWNEFKRLPNMVTSINRKRRKNDFATKLEENRGNPRAYWKTLRQILPSKTKISGTERLIVDEIELNDGLEIANSFNEYFTNVASTLLENISSPGIQQPVPQSQTPCKIFSLPTIIEWDMLKALSTMNHTKAIGIDNIPAKA